MKHILISTLILFVHNTNAQQETNAIQRFKDYFEAWNNYQFTSDDFRGYLNDTIYTWHGKKEGKGTMSVFNPFSKWKQWDVAMNGVYSVDSIRYIPGENKIIASFHETTDFLWFIGMPKGFSATVHYWLDDQGRVKEILYDWSQDNKDFKTQLKPLVDWAIKYDSLEIADLYLKDGFEPSWTNAIRWTRLMKKYRK